MADASLPTAEGEDVRAVRSTRHPAPSAAHGGPASDGFVRAVTSRRMVLLVWLPIIAIGLLHYGTPPEHHGIHNVLRRLYYLPIIVAAFQSGLGGALLAAAVVSVTYLPHAFLHIGHLAHTDPSHPVEKALEIVLYNAVGAVAGYLAGAERKRRAELQTALEEQQRLQRQLVRAGRLSSLGEVVAGIAHEVKNPLHALKGTAEVVAPLVPEDAEERRMWEIHVSEIDRLDRVADRFLSFASPKHGDIAPIDLRDVATRLVELVGADARKRGVTLDCELPDEPLIVAGDKDQLAQVGLNIALNALNAIGDNGGAIRVSVRRRSGQKSHAAELRIENDGPPLAEEDLEHLFDPFHGSGSGLGLSISERIVESHGGYIEAANGGLGVVFSVRLPEAPQ